MTAPTTAPTPTTGLLAALDAFLVALDDALALDAKLAEAEWNRVLVSGEAARIDRQHGFPRADEDARTPAGLAAVDAAYAKLDEATARIDNLREDGKHAWRAVANARATLADQSLIVARTTTATTTGEPT